VHFAVRSVFISKKNFQNQFSKSKDPPTTSHTLPIYNNNIDKNVNLCHVCYLKQLIQYYILIVLLFNIERLPRGAYFMLNFNFIS